MWNRALFRRPASIVLGAILFLLAFSGGHVFSQKKEEESRQRIEWAAAEGAKRYEVRIRDKAGKTVLEKSTETSFIEVSLDPGSYQVRITVLNVFDKPAVSSEWLDFKVVRTGFPEAAAVEPRRFYAGTGENSLRIQGGPFFAETKVRLRGSFGSVLPSRRESLEGETTLTVVFDLQGAVPGTYDLEIENPSERKNVLPRAIALLERRQPRAESFSLKEASNDRVYPGVVLRGAGFEEESEVTFVSRDGEELKPSAKETLAEGVVVMTLNLAEKRAGVYDLAVKNPGGLSSRLAGALAVKDALKDSLKGITISSLPSGKPEGSFPTNPAPGRAEAAQPQAEKPKAPAPLPGPEVKLPSAELPAEPPKPRMPGAAAEALKAAATLPAGGLYVSLGWPAAFILDSESADRFKSSFLGAALSLGFDLGASFRDLPVLNGLLFELAVQYSKFDGKGGTNVTSSSLQAGALGTCLAYRTRLDLPVDFLVRAGYGFTLSRAEKSSPLASYDETSQDTYLQAGAAVRWNFHPRFFAEAGADWFGIFYVGSDFTMVRPFLKAGAILY